MKMLLNILLVLTLFSRPVLAQFDNGRSDFSVVINNEIYGYNEFSVYALPHESLMIRTVGQTDLPISIETSIGDLDRLGDNRWIWKAPEKSGLTHIRLTRSDNESITLSVFVMVPSTLLRNGHVNGKLIGEYPPPLSDDPLYLRPDGFIEVTQENISTRLSPHFTLGQFASSTDDKFPRYIVLRERLLLKLEALLERVNENGITADTFKIIAGYLTPDYVINSGRDPYSRHIYGGAALIAVDMTPVDDQMDDLNQDGVINNSDARVLFDIADQLYQEADKRYLSGGLFLYRQANELGPYVMIDARGFRQRWLEESELFENPFKVKSSDRILLDQ